VPENRPNLRRVSTQSLESSSRGIYASIMGLLAVKRSTLFHRILGIMLPLLMAMSVLGHHHAAGVDSDHCEFCATLVAVRRRVLPSSANQEKCSPGGKPGEKPERVAYPTRIQAHPHQGLSSELPRQVASIPLFRVVLSESEPLPVTRLFRPPVTIPGAWPPLSRAPRAPPC